MSEEGGAHAKELDQTPTWAVAGICAIIILISIVLEEFLHMLGAFFQRKRKKAMFEALEKVKGELMILGFISLLLTFGQNYMAKLCIPETIGDAMLPCPPRFTTHHKAEPSEPSEPSKHEPAAEAEHHRRLLWNERRFLSADSEATSCREGYVQLISTHALHQLHIFIFFLAVFHVIYSAITMALGRLKTREWKNWEAQAWHESDAGAYRLTHETSFVRDHSNFWTRTPILFVIVCFCRQFFRSVRQADYLTLRHGFVTVHLAPGSKFDFRKYIKRSLEDDFKVVVGISPILWASVVVFLLLNVHGWQFMFWISTVPLIVILAVGTKLQSIITNMALEIVEKQSVVQGIPLVQVSDEHFWFSWPELVLYLIHFTLFQNAFEITYFFWIWYEFGLKSCFHSDFTRILVRVALGVGVQFLCSYITLPLYALVTQMGSTMKRAVFDDQTSKALKKWHMNAQKKMNEGKPEPGAARTLGSLGDSNAGGNALLAGQPEAQLPVPDPNAPPSHQGANVTASIDLSSSGPDLLT